MPAPGLADVQTDVIRWEDALPVEARRAWETLLACHPAPAASHMPAWWETVRETTQAGPWQIVIVREGRRPVLLAPFRPYSPWVWRVPTLFADDLPPVLVDPEREKVAWQGLAAWVAGLGGWRQLVLGRGTDARRLALTSEACDAYGCMAGARPWLPVMYTPLAETWEAFLAHLSPQARKNIRSAERKLQRDYPSMTLSFARHPAEVAAASETLARLYRARWQERDGSTVFDHPRYVAAFTAVMTHCCMRELAEIATLAIDGRPVVAVTCLHTPGQATAYAQYVGRDVTALPPHYSPGMVATVAVIRRLIERGARRLSLGNGESAYKYELGGAPTPQWTLALATSPAAALVAPALNKVARAAARLPWAAQTG